MVIIKKICGPLAFQLSSRIIRNSIGMKYCDKVFFMLYWSVGVCKMYSSYLLYGGYLKVIMSCDICDVPRSFSNHAEEDGLECLNGSVRYFYSINNLVSIEPYTVYNSL